MSEACVPTAASPETAPDQETIRARLAGTNINEESFLATDYLNHFNEIIMLLEMVPDMPECLDDCKAWQPRGYAEHFRESGFSDKALAILAYEHAPPQFRAPFDDTVSTMNRLIALGIERIDAALATGDRAAAAHEAERTTRALQKLVDVASAIIHGGAPTLDQDEIDSLLAH